jgi:hypothetical protein
MEQVSNFLESVLANDTNNEEFIFKNRHVTKSEDGSEPNVESNNPSGETTSLILSSSKLKNTNTNEDVVNTSIEGNQSDVSNRKKFSEIDFTTFFAASGKHHDDNHDKKNIPLSGTVITDKLFEKFLSVVAPINDSDAELTDILKRRVELQKLRPPLLYNTMSKNSTNLNARLSSTFVMFDNVSDFFNWENPSFTIGIQLVSTHCVLNPYLITILPCIVILGNYLIPSYLQVYPPDKSFSAYLDTNPIPSYNPLEKYEIPHPVNQYSREFFMNMTDMQNHQTDYVAVWDFMVWLTTDYFYFKNEPISALVYLGLVMMISFNLLILPWLVQFLLERIYIVQFFLIVQIWMIPILLHPEVRTIIMECLCKEETRLNTQNAINRIELYLCSFLVRPDDKCQIKDIEDLDAREVEIFELHRLDPETKIWNLEGFSTTMYTMNNSIRRANEELSHLDIPEEEKPYFHVNEKITKDEIDPPVHWKFIEDKWVLDLKVNEWVQNNLISDLVSVDDDEKWVYDYIDDNENDGSRPIYRRRRWIRNCRRLTYKDKEETEHKVSSSGWEF